MLMRRCTAAQFAEIQPFGVHLSMCLPLGEERARIPRRNALVFSCGAGLLMVVCKNQPPGFRGQILGESVRKNPPPSRVPRSDIAAS